MQGGSSGAAADPDPDASTGEGPLSPADRLDVGGPAQPLDDPQECASFTETSTSIKKPADIIFVVDNSPSMVEEADAVQARLSEFSQQIVDAGIDVRVFLLTAYPNPTVEPAIDTGICIDPPLGSGGCPSTDNNPPIFSHLAKTIGSSQALAELVETHPQWGPIVRDDSVKHVIVVSDDDSFISASEFDQQFRALDPAYDDYVLHGIVSLQPCAYSDTVGSQYVALADMTDGILGDLCEQDWQPLFDLLSTAVIEGTAIACDWAVPEPPEGQFIDPDSVEVQLEGPNVDPLTFGAVPDASACAAEPHGFFYDDPTAPTRMFACPQTCAALEDLTEASLTIEVGCATAAEG